MLRRNGRLPQGMGKWFGYSQQNQTGIVCRFTHIFRICEEQNFKVSARKTKPFSTTLKWCGRIISPHGVQLDLRNGTELTKGTGPINAGELCEYVPCISWMQNGIPDHARLTAPLLALLGKAYSKTDKRPKRSVKSISLSSHGWCKTHNTSFTDIHQILRKQIFLAQRDLEFNIWVFSDASGLFRASAVTHCKAPKLIKLVPEQRHQPLSFLSGAFKNTELGWNKVAKEWFASLQTFCRPDYMLLCEPLTWVFTDHRLLFCVLPGTP